MEDKPVRTIPIQQFSVAGKILSYKNRRMVSYESQLELAFIYHLEFSNEVKSYLEQPFKVPATVQGRKTHYIPDFLVSFKDPLKKPLIVEIKYLKDVKKNQEKILHKIEILEKFALRKGYEFRLLTDRELLGNRVKNYEFLYRFLSRPESMGRYEELRNKIISLIKKYQPIAVKEVIDILGGDDFIEKGLLLPVLWHLIATGEIETNLDVELTNYSFLTIPNYLNPYKEEKRCLL